MNRPSTQNGMIGIFIALSMITHLLVLFPIGKLGSYDFAQPVPSLQAVFVDLGKPEQVSSPVTESKAENVPDPFDAKGEPGAGATGGHDLTKRQQKAPQAPATVSVSARDASEPAKPTVTDTEDLDATANVPPVGEPKLVDATRIEETAAVNMVKGNESIPAADLSQAVESVRGVQPPLRNASEFLATQQETLHYRITMHGIPIGTAMLEAKNEQGELRITLKIKSSPVLSEIYPVDDLVETRHIGGNFIITKIRQQEGSFKSDRGFTLFLRDEKVFWQDNLKKISVWESLPNSEVLDILSGVYFLRNRQLKVGSTELLHVYDSDTYAHLPVEVLRQEQISLPGFRKADTIVVKPLLKTDGIFKRAGEMLIWLTDDDNKVPVKVETKIPLGKVTIELVSAETKQQGEARVAPNSRPNETDQILVGPSN